jgi:tetratricopeptide (TPR) repeat protein
VGPNGRPRRVDRLALGVFAIALGARLIHIWALKGSPFFSHLLVDSVDFDARAMALAQGGWAEEGAFYQAPLYPLFLSFLYRIFGHGLTAVRIVQALLGSGTAVLVYLIGRRCGGGAVGVGAGLMAALYSMAIHFDAEILRPSLVIFLSALSLHLLLLSSEKGGARKWGAAGLVLGLAAVGRPTLLAFVPAAALWALLRRRRERGADTVAAAVFLCCALVPVGVVTSINYARSGQAVLISYNGGINFFIGNNPDYERTVAIRPGIRWDLLTAEPPADRGTDPAGWSGYYYGLARDYIFSDPSGYAALLFKKLVLFWNGHEIERNVDFSHVAEHSPFMAYKIVSFRWIAPLALMGMVLAAFRRAPLGLPALYLVSQMGATVAFFVCARYRMISMPALWVFAAYGAVALGGMLKRRGIEALPYLGLALLAGVGVNSDAYDISQKEYARSDYELALIERREGRTKECLRLLERSKARRPDDPDPPFQQGVTLAGSGRYAEAAEAFREAARIEPRYPLTWFNLGFCLGEAGRHGEAAESYRRALELEPDYLPAWMGLARAEAEAGRYEASLEYLDSAIELEPECLEARLAKARILKAMGSLLEARLETDRAARLAPSDPRVKALMKELEQ